MAAPVCNVTVEAELICAVENLATLRTEAMFYLTFHDAFGNMFADGTILVDLVDGDSE